MCQVLHKLHHLSIDLKLDLILLEVLSLISGSYEKGAVEVTNCFTVPHNESEDEVHAFLILVLETPNDNLFKHVQRMASYCALFVITGGY